MESATTKRFRQVGYTAFQRGESSAFLNNHRIIAALDRFKPGDPRAIQAIQAFQTGYQTAAEEYALTLTRNMGEPAQKRNHHDPPSNTRTNRRNTKRTTE